MSKDKSKDQGLFRPLVFSGLSFDFITNTIYEFFKGNSDPKVKEEAKTISQLLNELTRKDAVPLTEKIKSVIEEKKNSKELTALEPKKTDKEAVSTYESNKSSLEQERLADGTYKFTPKGEFSGVVQVQRKDPSSGKLLEDYDTLVYDKGKISFVMPGLNGQSRISEFAKLFKEAEVSVKVPAQEKKKTEAAVDAPTPQRPSTQKAQAQQPEPSIGDPIPSTKRDMPSPQQNIATPKPVAPAPKKDTPSVKAPKPQTKKVSLQDRASDIFYLGEEIQAELKKEAERAKQRNSEKPAAPFPLSSGTPKSETTYQAPPSKPAPDQAVAAAAEKAARAKAAEKEKAAEEERQAEQTARERDAQVERERVAEWERQMAIKEQALFVKQAARLERERQAALEKERKQAAQKSKQAVVPLSAESKVDATRQSDSKTPAPSIDIGKEILKLQKDIELSVAMIRIADRRQNAIISEHWKDNKRESEKELELLIAKARGASKESLEEKTAELKKLRLKTTESYKEFSDSDKKFTYTKGQMESRVEAIKANRQLRNEILSRDQIKSKVRSALEVGDTTRQAKPQTKVSAPVVEGSAPMPEGPPVPPTGPIPDASKFGGLSSNMPNLGELSNAVEQRRRRIEQQREKKELEDAARAKQAAELENARRQEGLQNQAEKRERDNQAKQKELESQAAQREKERQVAHAAREEQATKREKEMQVAQAERKTQVELKNASRQAERAAQVALAKQRRAKGLQAAQAETREPKASSTKDPIQSPSLAPAERPAPIQDPRLATIQDRLVSNGINEQRAEQAALKKQEVLEKLAELRNQHTLQVTAQRESITQTKKPASQAVNVEELAKQKAAQAELREKKMQELDKRLKSGKGISSDQPELNQNDAKPPLTPTSIRRATVGPKYDGSS